MSEVSKRLEQAGMLLPAVATPVAAYTPAIALEGAGGLVAVSYTHLTLPTKA